MFIEGGGVTVSRFLEANLLDRLQIAVAPVLIGEGRPAIRLRPQTFRQWTVARTGDAVRVDPPTLGIATDIQVVGTQIPRRPYRTDEELRGAIVEGPRVTLTGTADSMSDQRLALARALPPEADAFFDTLSWRTPPRCGNAQRSGASTCATKARAASRRCRLE